MLEAIRSIKDSMSRSLFYLLTFIITSMFMFVFFNLSYSDAVGVTFINAKNNASLLITVLVIAVCMIVIFFANNFFVVKKSKELAVRLVCGASFIHIAFYTLFQTLILFIIAIPIGITIGLIVLPLLQSLIYVITHTNVMLMVSSQAIYSTALIIVIEIVFCTILNVGYVYRSSIQALLNDKSVQKIQFKFPIQFLSIKTKQILYILCFILPIPIMYMNYKNQESILILSVIGMIGLYGCMNHVIVPMMNHIILKHLSNSQLVGILGMVRNDIKILSMNIILLIVSDVLSISILTNSTSSIEIMVCIISFVVINILLMMSIMFKFSSEIVGRKKHYQIYLHIGYTLRQVKKMMFQEVFIFFMFVIVTSLIYIFNILIILNIHHLLTINVVIGLLVCFILPSILCMLGSYLYYRKEVNINGI